MRPHGEPARLDVAAAIEHGALRGTVALHRSADNPTIDSIALISRSEQARRVTPRAAVVVAAGPETSGWLVSSVLRYAWERRASLVVATGGQAESVLALARRLDITLLTSHGDPTTLALDLAADIGAANAAVEARLVALLRAVQRATDLDAMLEIASAELGGLPLELRFRGAVVAGAGDADRAGRVELGPFAISDVGADTLAVSAFPSRASGRTGLAEAALELVAPVLRGAWFEAESADRLDGFAAAAAAVDDPGFETIGSTDPAFVERLGWPAGESHVVVFLTPARGAPSRALGNVVRLLWRRAVGAGALAATRDGWLAVLPAEDDDTVGDLVARLREHLAPALGELGIGVGISSADDAPGRLSSLVVEARLAARCAWGIGDGEVGSFADLELGAAGYLFDPGDARAIAGLVLPEFCTAPDLAVLVESVAVFLDEGSMSAAVSALSIHRNTLTARLDRARSLGLPLGEPGTALAVAVIVRALRHAATHPTDAGEEIP